MQPSGTIDAPRPVYGLQWTGDGERLAYSGGSFYGGGFLGLARHDGRVLALRDQGSLSAEEALRDGEVILPALCIDDTGSWILTAACRDRWHARGPLLFRVEDDKLSLVATPGPPEDVDGDILVQRATGAWIHRGELVVRYIASATGDVLHRSPAPAEIHAGAARSGQSSARITVVGDTVWTAKNQIARYSERGTGAPMTPGSELRLILEPHGIVALDLAAAEGSVCLQPTDRAERIQALVRDRDGEHLYAGLGDGQIVEWRIVDGDRLERRRSWRHTFTGNRSAPVARGIQAMCLLADGETLVSAHVSGTIALWRDGRCIEHFTVAPPWSPRSLAAPPRSPLLAVGCKGRRGDAPGSVLLYDLTSQLRS